MAAQSAHASDDSRSQVTAVLDVVQALLGRALASDEMDSNFMGLGCDSLHLMQLSEELEKATGVSLSFREIWDECDSPRRLVARIEQEVGRLAGAAGTAAPTPGGTEPAAVRATPAVGAAGMHGVEQLMEEQIALLERQMRLLRAMASGHTPTEQMAPTSGGIRCVDERAPARDDALASAAATMVEEPERVAREGTACTWPTALRARTLKSRAHVAAAMPKLADYRFAGVSVAGDELTDHPIVCDRAQGARIWDVDGNEYLDLVMGYGVHLFGHAPQFIRRAIAAQLDIDMSIGSLSPLASDVASQISELTGHERVLLCNTGSEAVLLALRLARTATKRDGIVMFDGSYHGISDGVLVAASSRGVAPAVPGVPPSAIRDTTLLEYGAPAALEHLRRLSPPPAAVIVEPVRHRRLDVRPVAFLHELRRIADERGIVLIFDEMVTGFRAALAGAQAVFGVKPDLTTYGKIIGGGFPIAAVAGRAEYFRGVDGGWPRSSASDQQRTLVATTFARHPLALRSANALLSRMAADGAATLECLTERTQAVVAAVNAAIERLRLPCEAHSFASMFRLKWHGPDAARWTRVLPSRLLERGVHTWQGRTHFVSTAHSPQDLDAITDALVDAAASVCGVTPTRTSNGTSGTPSAGQVGAVQPLSDGQRAIWIICQSNDDANQAYITRGAMRLNGFDLATFRAALERVTSRVPVLRAEFDADEMRIQERSETVVSERTLPSGADAVAAADELSRALAASIDLTRPPVVKFGVIRVSPDETVLVRAMHHIAFDGWSSGRLMQLLDEAYRGGVLSTLSEEHRRPRSAKAADLEFWCQRLNGMLPWTWLDPDVTSARGFDYRGGSIVTSLADVEPLARHATRARCTTFALLNAAFLLSLHEFARCDQLTVGLSVNGWPDDGRPLGYALNLVPMASTILDGDTFGSYVARIQDETATLVEHSSIGIPELLPFVKMRRPPHRCHGVPILISYERARDISTRFGGRATRLELPVTHVKRELEIRYVNFGRAIRVDLDFAEGLFTRRAAETILQHMQNVLATLSTADRLSDIPIATVAARS